MSEKIRLAEGQRSAEYTIADSGTFHELGLKLDSFLSLVDYSTSEVGDITLHPSVIHIRSMQTDDPIAYSNLHSATVTLWSRKYA